MSKGVQEAQIIFLNLISVSQAPITSYDYEF